MKKCPQCGAVVRLTARFCEQCGHAFRTNFANQTQMLSHTPQPQSGNSTEQGYPLVAVLLALFGVIAVYFEPPIALLLALGSLVFAGLKLRGVTALAVGLALLVIVAVAITEGYEAGMHRARMESYNPYQRANPYSSYPALPGY